ncbi:MAG: hypothetical protein JWL67_2561, partial [Solirubrobacterales bacterium]|nr:hypothetical protein [Solirubrobacterales bacterium]
GSPEPAPVAARGEDQWPPAGAEPPGGGGRSNRRGAGGWVAGHPLYVALGAAAVAAVVAVVLLSSSSSKKSSSGTPSTAALAQVPTNHVTGSGDVTVRLTGHVAKVTLTTNGLDYNEALGHALHIHGGGKGQCPPTSAARPHNGHRSISTTDGINYYGAPVQALTTRGDTSTSSILTFSRYPTGGNIRYTRTITLPPPVAAYIRQNNAVVVVHGVDYDHSGIYSGVLDRSELNKSVPGTATAPALCGVLSTSKTTASLTSPDAGGAIYTATLRESAEQVTPASELFMCGAIEGATAVGGSRRAGRHLAAADSAASTLG